MNHLVRNIGVFAHVDSGKTTFVERVLFETKQIYSPGTIEEGTTESDTLGSEIKRGISIFSSLLQTEFKYKSKTYKINFIDTPGHIDFFSQVEDTFSVIDIGILLIDTTTGIRVQTERLYEELSNRKIPILIFLNKIDKNKDIEEFMIDLSAHFSLPLVPLFSVVDSSIRYNFLEKEIFEEEELSYIEWSDDYTKKYLKKPSKKILIDGLKEGFKNLKFLPCIPGSALKGQGIKELLIFLVSQEVNKNSTLAQGILFSRRINSEFGKLVLIKSFKELGCNKEYFLENESFSFEKFYEWKVGEKVELDFIPAGGIYAATTIPPKTENRGFFSIDPFSVKKRMQKFEYSFFLEPNKLEDKELLKKGLEDLVWEDSGLELGVREDTTQFELRGAGELHLEVAKERLIEFIGNRFQVSNFHVAKYELFKNMEFKINFEHSAFDEKLKSGTLSCIVERSSDFSNITLWEFLLEEELKSSVESAVYEILSNGIHGFPLLGIRFRFLSYERPEVEHEHLSSLLKVATISGIKSLLKNNSYLIGPLVQFEIMIPDSNFGVVVASLNKKEANILSSEVVTNQRILLKGEASAENMLGFQGVLRNMTQGRGYYSSRVFFDKEHYFEFRNFLGVNKDG